MKKLALLSMLLGLGLFVAGCSESKPPKPAVPAAGGGAGAMGGPSPDAGTPETTPPAEGDKEMPADEGAAPADEKPADSAPADEKPADEKPADEKPADEDAK